MTGAILFVCAANRCRSPLAMALLQRLVSQQSDERPWRIESGGLYAIPDMPATEDAQLAAQQAGVDLSHHRSRSLEQLRLAEFDLILTMEQIQAEAIVSAYPLLKARVQPFTTMVKFHADIADPTGQGLNEHYATVALLRRYLQAGLPYLHRRLFASG